MEKSPLKKKVIGELSLNKDLDIFTEFNMREDFCLLRKICLNVNLNSQARKKVEKEKVQNQTNILMQKYLLC